MERENHVIKAEIVVGCIVWVTETGGGYRDRFRARVLARPLDSELHLSNSVRVQVIKHEANYTRYKDGHQLTVNVTMCELE